MPGLNFDTDSGPSTYYGTGAPDAQVGRNGDFYQDTSTGALYGPKEAGRWPSGLNVSEGGGGTGGGSTGGGGTGAQGPPGPPGPGVAAGGTANQILAKATDTDYDTHWIDPTAGGGPTTATDIAFDAAVPFDDGASPFDGNGAGPSAVLEGVRITGFGHSFTMCTLEQNGAGAGSESSLYLNRLGSRFGASVDIRGQAGGVVGGMVEQMVAGNAGPANSGGLVPVAPFHVAWRPGTDFGVVIIDIMRNDVAQWGPSGGAHDVNSTAVNAYTASLRTALRWFRASSASITEFPSGGSWGPLGTIGHNADCIFTTTAGATVDMTFTGQEVVWHYLMRNNDLAGTGGIIEVVYAGSVVKTIDTNLGFPTQANAFGTLYGNTYCWLGDRITTADIPALSTGSNTVTIRKKTGDANVVVLDCHYTPTATALPRVYVIQDPDPPTYIENETAGAYITYRAAIAAVCAEAEFTSYVRTTDISDWDASSMMDGFHPNDKGGAAFADTLEPLIRGDITTWMSGVHRL